MLILRPTFILFLLYAIGLQEVQSGFNTLPLFKCELGFDERKNDDAMYSYAGMIYRFMGYGNVAYPRGEEFQYPIWIDDYNQTFPDKCFDICLGGKKSCNISTKITYPNGQVENRIGCTQNVFYPFMADVTYQQCQNVSFIDNDDAEQVVNVDWDDDCDEYDIYDDCPQLKRNDDDENQYSGDLWYQCATEMALTFLDKDFAELYTQPYDIVKIGTATFFSTLGIIENYLTAEKLYVDHGINLWQSEFQRSHGFHFSKYTDFISVIIKAIISSMQLILFAYLYFGSIENIYPDFECAGNIAGSFRFIFILTHLSSPMFLPMLIDTGPIVLFPPCIVFIAVLVVPCLLLVCGLWFAACSLITVLLPVFLVHLITIICMIAASAFIAVIVTLFSIFASYCSGAFFSTVGKFIKKKILFCCFEDNDFSLAKNNEESERIQRHREFHRGDHGIPFTLDPTIIIVLIAPPTLLGLMIYVNPYLCETCTTVSYDDPTPGDRKTFHKYWMAAFFSIYRDLDWSWDLIKIDWKNFSWIEITGLPKIEITFTPPSWNYSVADYVHAYMLSWSLKILSIVISIPLKVGGIMLDGLFGFNYKSPRFGKFKDYIVKDTGIELTSRV